MRADHLALHFEQESTHWWFVARRRILLDTLSRYLPALSNCASARDRRAHTSGGARTRNLQLLDVGCGGGVFLEKLSQYGTAVGLDAAPEAVEVARNVSGCEVHLGILPHQIPVADSSFDVITALDVVEHLDEDVVALERLSALLAPGGLLLCTVPAYQFLWSRHDEVNAHKRRYTRPELSRKLTTAGFHVLYATYFNTLLFPPIAAVRWLRRGRNVRDTADSGIVPSPVNTVLKTIFGWERFLLRRMTMPFGVSVLALAQKPAERRMVTGDEASTESGTSHKTKESDRLDQAMGAKVRSVQG